MSNDLVVVQSAEGYDKLPLTIRESIEQHLLAPPKQVEGDFLGDDRKWAPTYVKLLQKPPDIPNPDLKPGEYFGAGVLPRPMPFTPLAIWQSRILWGKAGTKDAGQILCKSPNSKTPSMKNTWGATECRSCKYSKKGQDNKCKLSLNIAALGGDYKRVYVLQFAGSSYMTGRLVYKQVKDIDPIYAYSFLLNSSLQTAPGIKFYKATIDEVQRTPKGLYGVLEVCRGKVVEYVNGLLTRGTTTQEEGEAETEAEETVEVSDSEAKNLGLMT